MKKTLLMILLLAVGFWHSFAMGIGAQADMNFTHYPEENHSTCLFTGLSGTAKFDGQPLYYSFSTDYAPMNYRALVSLNADWHFAKPQIAPLWNLYFGIGAGAGFELTASSAEFFAGPRAVIGSSWTLLDGFLELFAQEAIQPNIQIPLTEHDKNNFWTIQFPLSVGVRIWD